MLLSSHQAVGIWGGWEGAMAAFLLCPSTGTQLIMALLFPILEDLLLVFSFLGSHPLQLGYLLFFSSYIIRVLSFLFPLLLTTSLLLLAFLTVAPFVAEPPDISPAFFKNTCIVVLDALKARLEDRQSADPAAFDFGSLNSIFAELEMCMNVAVEDYCEEEEDKVPIEEDEHKKTTPKEEGEEEEGEDYYEDKAPIDEGDSNSKSGYKEEEEKEKEKEDAVLNKETLFSSSRLIGWEEFEAIGKLYKALTNEVGEYPIKLAIRNLKKKQLFASPDAVAKEGSFFLERSASVLSLDGWETPVSELEEVESPTTVIKSAEFVEKKEADGVEKASSGFEELATESLRRYGSVRSAKEWKRTLAGKLYEERWTSIGSVGDEEEMDSLWEEGEAAAAAVGAGDGKGRKGSNGKGEQSSVGMKENKNNDSDSKGEEKKKNQRSKSSRREEREEEEEEEVEEDEVVGRFCCLHALKFSTGRMNLLGLGKVGGKLVKASKALKGGAALFQHSGRRSRRERLELR